MDVHVESPDVIERRILRVLAASEFVVYPQTYTFEEFPLNEFPASINRDALALVRDDQVWSQLVPANDPRLELFGLFRFHFAADIPNSGFVGWLATHFKTKFGTGVFVVCGQNSSQGGIFDYWGSPLALFEVIVKEVEHLRSLGREISDLES
jgi:hypothetical protein